MNDKKSEKKVKKQNKYVIRQKGRIKERGEGSLAELVSEGYEIRCRIQELKDRLDVVEGGIIEFSADFFSDSGTCHIITGGIDCEVRISEDMIISDPDRLKKILGNRFDDLVRVKAVYKPERKLLGIIRDPDNADIATAVDVTERTSVSYRMVKDESGKDI